MLIGMDVTRANKPQKTGVEWYAYHVIQELKKISVKDGNSWVMYSNALLSGGLEALPENWYEDRLRWPLPYGWTQLALSWELKKHPIDVLWMPGSTLPRVHPRRLVVTVHDIGFHHHPELYPKRQIAVHERSMREIAKRAERILTVSEFSARDISESYGIDSRKIAITPCGIDHDTYKLISDPAEIDQRLQRYRLSRPYFIVVGRLEAKKNLVTLVKAWEQFKTRRGVGDPHKLVFVGSAGHGSDAVFRAIQSSPVKSDFVHLGYVPEVDLPALLNGAVGLIHPSHFEGFGIPPVQAMACGTPVIASNAASLPEICGEAAMYADPNSPEQFAHLMDTLIQEPSKRQTMQIAGMTQSAKYTWKSTAEKTLPVLANW